MKRNLIKTFATAGAAALLLAACSDDSGSDEGDGGGSDESQDPVYAEMASWNACEVLDNLQPITDYMGILGYGSSTAEGGEPGNSEIGNTLDPEAIGCNGLIYLGTYTGSSSGSEYAMSGEIHVKIVPASSEEEAAASYETRVSSAEGDAAGGSDAMTQEFSDPWDQGTLISWIGDADQPNMQVIAQDGQWVFHIRLYHTNDYGLRGGEDPALAFTEDELGQWFVNDYLPEVNQSVNDRIAEVL